MRSFKVCEEMLDMLVELQWDIEGLTESGDLVLDTEFYDKEDFLGFLKFLITQMWYPECISIHDAKAQYLLRDTVYELYRSKKMVETRMRIVDNVMQSYKASK